MHGLPTKRIQNRRVHSSVRWCNINFTVLIVCICFMVGSQLFMEFTIVKLNYIRQHRKNLFVSGAHRTFTALKVLSCFQFYDVFRFLCLELWHFCNKCSFSLASSEKLDRPILFILWRQTDGESFVIDCLKKWSSIGNAIKSKHIHFPSQ